MKWNLRNAATAPCAHTFFAPAMALALMSIACKEQATQGQREQPGAAAAHPAGEAAPVVAPAAPVDTVADACTVFSQRDVSGVFGVEVKQSASNTTSKTADGLPLTTCTWEQGGATPTDYVVNFQADNFLTADPRAKEFFNNSRVTGGSMSFVELSGIGDEAVFYRTTSAKPVQASMGWRKGNVVFSLSVVRMAGLDVAAAETKLKALADLKY